MIKIMKKSIWQSLLLCASVFLFSGLSACDKQPANTNQQEVPAKADLRVEGARMLAPPPGKKMAAVYLTLHNEGLEQRQIFSIETDVAGVAEVHRTQYEDGVMKMRQVDHVRIAPKSKLDFEPRGLHIMLMQLEKTLEAGDTFQLYVQLDKGEVLEVPVAVQSVH